jgi:NAD+ synthase (glutamine-hydrolysing)
LGADAIVPPPGATRETVRNIAGRLDRNEYKRRQSPLVLRTSPKAFGTGRRLPIVHRYSGRSD